MYNVFLLRWNGGWAERADAASIAAVGRIEAVLGLGAEGSLAEVYRIADEQLAEFARERAQLDITILPVDETETPYQPGSFKPGDTITVDGTPHRVLGMTVAVDDETGIASYIPALNTDIVLGPQERQAQALTKMLPGTLGGRSKVAQPIIPAYVARGLTPPGAEVDWELVSRTVAFGQYLEPSVSIEGTDGLLWTAGPWLPFGTGPSFWSWDPSTDTWTDHTPDWTFNHNTSGSYLSGVFGIGSYGGKIALIFYDSIHSVFGTMVYDIAGNSWASGVSPSTTTTGAAGFWWGYTPGGRYIYMLTNNAGFTTAGFERYDIQSNVWTHMTVSGTMFHAVGHGPPGEHAVQRGGVVSGIAYVQAGNQPAGAVAGSVHAYNIAGDAWTQLTDDPDGATHGMGRVVAPLASGKLLVERDNHVALWTPDSTYEDKQPLKTVAVAANNLGGADEINSAAGSCMPIGGVVYSLFWNAGSGLFEMWKFIGDA